MLSNKYLFKLQIVCFLPRAYLVPILGILPLSLPLGGLKWQDTYLNTDMGGRTPHLHQYGNPYCQVLLIFVSSSEYKLYTCLGFSVVNMAQILPGCASEYLSHIHLCSVVFLH
jgi:hypothetical protein